MINYNILLFSSLLLAGYSIYTGKKAGSRPKLVESFKSEVPKIDSTFPSNKSLFPVIQPVSTVPLATSHMTDLTNWQPPESAKLYTALISTVERQHGMPGNLLARLLYQESRFRPEIINGSLKSRVGAAGIAQVMPLTASGPGYGTGILKNPLDPFEAIPWAGQYLRGLYNASGKYTGRRSWQRALAAYNYGPGNVNKAVKKEGFGWLALMPTETKNYVEQISRDVPAIRPGQYV